MAQGNLPRSARLGLGLSSASPAAAAASSSSTSQYWSNAPNCRYLAQDMCDATNSCQWVPSAGSSKSRRPGQCMPGVRRLIVLDGTQRDMDAKSYARVVRDAMVRIPKSASEDLVVRRFSVNRLADQLTEVGREPSVHTPTVVLIIGHVHATQEDDVLWMANRPPTERVRKPNARFPDEIDYRQQPVDAYGLVPLPVHQLAEQVPKLAAAGEVEMQRFPVTDLIKMVLVAFSNVVGIHLASCRPLPSASRLLQSYDDRLRALIRAPKVAVYRRQRPTRAQGWPIWALEEHTSRRRNRLRFISWLPLECSAQKAESEIAWLYDLLLRKGSRLKKADIQLARGANSNVHVVSIWPSVDQHEDAFSRADERVADYDTSDLDEDVSTPAALAQANLQSVGKHVRLTFPMPQVERDRPSVDAVRHRLASEHRQRTALARPPPPVAAVPVSAPPPLPRPEPRHQKLTG